MRKYFFLFQVYLLFLFSAAFSQQPLYIPDTLMGTVFNLTVQAGTKQFFAGQNTPTFGYNGNFLGPTLIMNKDDTVTLNVTNTLNVPTTVHWHGFHIPAKDDGGPHQVINPNTTWSPSFKIRNNASTYWYHPHGEGKTEIQISKGLAGVIIIRDTVEAQYNLPRTYNADDFPLIVQSRVFDVFYQVQTATHEDSIPMVNGIINPYLPVPQQMVRFRLLNASADRSYLFGLSDNSNFYVIASDGGLLAQPHQTNRLRLSTGERAEILVDFGSYTIGQQIYLMSYASELPKGIIGADSVGTSTILISDGYYGNPLNGLDFNLLRFDVIAPTANPVTTIPASFAPITYIPASSATVNRTIVFTPDTVISGQQGYVDGPFMMNDEEFHMDSINQVVYVNDTEIWSLVNKTMVAHPFHIHMIQFFVLDINGNPPPPEYAGYKDVILVQPNDTVRFIGKFEIFADDSIPYMYHCHLLHHEDDGMMHAFLVIDTTASQVKNLVADDGILIFPNPSYGDFIVAAPFRKYEYMEVELFSFTGEKVYEVSVPEGRHEFAVSLPRSLGRGIYCIRIKTKKGIFTKKLVLK